MAWGWNTVSIIIKLNIVFHYPSNFFPTYAVSYMQLVSKKNLFHWHRYIFTIFLIANYETKRFMSSNIDVKWIYAISIILNAKLGRIKNVSIADDLIIQTNKQILGKDMKVESSVESSDRSPYSDASPFSSFLCPCS